MLKLCRFGLCSLVAVGTFISFCYLAGIMLIVAQRQSGDVAGVLAVMSLAMIVIGVAMAVVNFAEINDALRGRWRINGDTLKHLETCPV